jgi:hypothetical protein
MEASSKKELRIIKLEIDQESHLLIAFLEEFSFEFGRGYFQPTAEMELDEGHRGSLMGEDDVMREKKMKSRR